MGHTTDLDNAENFFVSPYRDLNSYSSYGSYPSIVPPVAMSTMSTTPSRQSWHQGLVSVILVNILAVDWVVCVISQLEGSGESEQAGPVTESKLISEETKMTRITSQFPQHVGLAE